MIVACSGKRKTIELTVSQCEKNDLFLDVTWHLYLLKISEWVHCYYTIFHFYFDYITLYTFSSIFLFEFMRNSLISAYVR